MADENINSPSESSEISTSENINQIDESETASQNIDSNPSSSSNSENEEDLALSASESRLRANILLIVIGCLFAFAVIVIVWMPPLSWSPQKGVKSDFIQTTHIEGDIEANLNPAIQLGYKNIVSEVTYRAEIEQVSDYQKDAFSTFKFKANLDVNRPNRRDYEDAIAIKLSEVDVHIFDGAVDEVNLASAGDLLQGIYVYSRLDKNNGMTSIVPDANINPQIARMLFSLSDALRQIWMPLPADKISVGSSWHLVDDPQGDMGFKRVAKVTLISMNDGVVTLKSEIALERVGKDNAQNNIGKGEMLIVMKDGEVESGTGFFERTNEAIEGSSKHQKTTLKIERAKK